MQAHCSVPCRKGLELGRACAAQAEAALDKSLLSVLLHSQHIVLHNLPATVDLGEAPLQDWLSWDLCKTHFEWHLNSFELCLSFIADLTAFASLVLTRACTWQI